LRSIAPSGYALHLPKGGSAQLDAAFEVIPEGQRDSWRLHKVEPGDTLPSLARRYGATMAALAAANHGELPDSGLWAAIPVSYPGDRPAKATMKAPSAPKAPIKSPLKAPVKASLKPSTGAAGTSGTSSRPALKSYVMPQTHKAAASVAHKTP